MRVTRETINGRECTVVRRPFDADYVRDQLAMGIPVLVEESYDGTRHLIYRWYFEVNKEYAIAGGGKLPEYMIKHTLAILPPLPRNPKPEDAALLYRYAAEGIFAWAEFIPLTGGTPNQAICASHWQEIMDCGCNITHATDTDGNSVEVAIKENE